MKAKLPFYTEKFYGLSYATIHVLQKIKQNDLDVDFEMYGSGEFMFMAAKDCLESRLILSEVISDINAYVAHYKDSFSEATPGSISLCGLHQEHTDVHGNDCEIMWDAEREIFLGADAFYSDDDEYEEDCRNSPV